MKRITRDGSRERQTACALFQENRIKAGTTRETLSERRAKELDDILAARARKRETSSALVCFDGPARQELTDNLQLKVPLAMQGKYGVFDLAAKGAARGWGTGAGEFDAVVAPELAVRNIKNTGTQKSRLAQLIVANGGSTIVVRRVAPAGHSEASKLRRAPGGGGANAVTDTSCGAGAAPAAPVDADDAQIFASAQVSFSMDQVQGADKYAPDISAALGNGADEMDVGEDSGSEAASQTAALNTRTRAGSAGGSSQATSAPEQPARASRKRDAAAATGTSSSSRGDAASNPQNSTEEAAAQVTKKPRKETKKTKKKVLDGVYRPGR